MENKTTSETSIADLINLLDKATLDRLYARLEAVSNRLRQSEEDSDLTSDPAQMLFEFIDDGITGTNEYLDRGNMADRVLDTLKVIAVNK